MNQALITGLFNGFVDRYGEAITPEQRLVCQKTGRQLRRLSRRGVGDRSGSRAWCTATTGWTTCCSAGPGSLRDLTVVDWQTVTWGPALTDVAYFLGCALKTEDRRAHYDELLGRLLRRAGTDTRR